MHSIGIPQLALTDRTRHILPETIAANEDLKNRYCQAFSKTAAVYEELKGLGVDEETLAYVLLSGNTLDIVTTINGRELLLFMKLRSCNRAQWEIRELARMMRDAVLAVVPQLAPYLVPKCEKYGKEFGFCMETKKRREALKCNRHPRLADVFEDYTHYRDMCDS
jgi:thymidylate synthase (FAD)